MDDVRHITNLHCLEVERRQPDLRMRCYSFSEDYIDVFVREAEVIFVAHYSFLEQASTPHVLALHSDEIDAITTFLANTDKRPLRICKGTMRLALGMGARGKLNFRLAIARKHYGWNRPFIVAEMADVRALLSLLTAWLRESHDTFETITFGLA